MHCLIKPFFKLTEELRPPYPILGADNEKTYEITCNNVILSSNCRNLACSTSNARNEICLKRVIDLLTFYFAFQNNEETCATVSIQLSLTSQQHWLWDEYSKRGFKGKQPRIVNASNKNFGRRNCFFD
jgi:hypothetical protein